MEGIDKFEFAKETEDLAPKNSHLLGRTALRNTTSISESAERAEKLHALGAPDFIVKNEDEILENRIERYLSEDYDVNEEVRELLSDAPKGVKQAQNIIFSELAKENEFITRTINPEKIDLRNSQAYLLSVLGIGPKVPAVYYDFIGKITEKDEEGNYVLPDETVKNFVSWYHAKTAEKSKEVLENMEGWWPEAYNQDLEIAVSSGVLPASLAANAKKRVELECGVLDPINAYEQGNAGEFFAIGGQCEKNIFSIEKKIRLGLGKEEYDAMKIFYHEFTHVISGDAIAFDGNAKAEAIFVEAMTESIATRVLGMIDVENHNDEEEQREAAAKITEKIGYFGGKPYKIERKILEYLQSGGKKEIDPMEFYEAYAEVDEKYEAIRNEEYGKYDQNELDDILDNPQRTYGPKQQKLIDDLLEAFPDCKDLAGLGRMIVEKFEELKNEKN